MLLANDGRLGVDDPVSRYLQGTPESWTPITIRHLLTHTAGLVRESPAFDPNENVSDADIVRAVYRVPLRFAPGSKYEYSNTGYWALAEINEPTRRQMWEPVRLTDGRTAEYGFGWHVDSVAGRRIWHGGGLPGFSAQYVRFPNAGVTVILLANGDDSDTASMANGLAAQFYVPKTN